MRLLGAIFSLMFFSVSAHAIQFGDLNYLMPVVSCRDNPFADQMIRSMDATRGLRVYLVNLNFIAAPTMTCLLWLQGARSNAGVTSLDLDEARRPNGLR